MGFAYPKSLSPLPASEKNKTKQKQTIVIFRSCWGVTLFDVFQPWLICMIVVCITRAPPDTSHDAKWATLAKKSSFFAYYLACSHAGRPSRSNWNFEMLVFVEEEARKTQRKTLRANRKPATNSTFIWYRAGIEPRPHWWQAITQVEHSTAPYRFQLCYETL